MTMTSEEFLTSVKRSVTVPSNQVRFSDSSILALGDEETEATILPMLLSIRQDYLVKKRYTAVVANQAEYKIPARAVGRTLRDIKLVDTNYRFFRSLAYIPLDRAASYSLDQTGDPTAFTVRGEYVVLLPTPQSSNAYYLEEYYELAPSKLVESSAAGVINSIDTNTGIITIVTAVSGFTTGASMDIIDSRTGNSVLAEGIANTNVASTSITFDPDDIPSTVQVGDYLALANQTPVVQLPQELTQSLTQAVVVRILEALGDYEGLRASTEKLRIRLDAAEKLLTPRVESKAPVVVNNNGLLRRGISPFFRYRW